MANHEIDPPPARRPPRCPDVGDTRPRRPTPAPVEQLSQRVPATLCQDFDAAVRTVADPTCEVQSARQPACCGPEKYALNPTLNREVKLVHVRG